MFDPISVEKIKSAPELDGIDRDRLPEYLSEMYTRIVELRRKFSISKSDVDKSDHDELSNLWRMAHTYSVLVVGGGLDDQQKSGAAFVAGNAFSLIWQANKIGLTTYTEFNSFTNFSISPIILSAILFIIAEQPADAYEASEKIEIKSEPTSPIDILEKAIYCLVRGNLIENLKIPNAAPPQNIGAETDLESLAYQVLWERITNAIKNLSQELLDETGSGEFSTWQLLLSNVVEISQRSEKNEGIEFLSSFAAPFHLASLLLVMGDELYQKSVVRIPTPPGLNQNLWKGYLQTIAKKRPYLWKNHFEAIQNGFLTPGISSIITFPTGTGKSTITEFKIVSSLLTGKSVVFLTPTKALVDQVEQDLKKNLEQYFTEDRLVQQHFDSISPDFAFGDLVNGSVVEDSYFIDYNEAFPSVVVMTPERCLSMMSVERSLFNKIGLIVFDECHLLHGGDTYISRRGIDAMFAFLNLISIPDTKPDVLLASAMVENGEELKGWIQELLEKECLSLDMRWKPTRQARGCVIYDSAKVTQLNRIVRAHLKESTTKKPPKKLQDQLLIKPEGLFCLQQTWNTQSSNDYTKIGLLDEDLKLSATGNRPHWRLAPNRNKVAAKIGQFFSMMGVKTLIFADSPRAATSIAKETAKLIDDSFSISYLEEDQKLLEICLSEVGSSDHIYSTFDTKTACHHGLLLLPERRLAEQIFKRSDGTGINLLAATPTLAQGMNLPVELVILAGDDRFDRNADARELLKAHELLNASGRAGRAGWIATGLVILIPSEIIAVEETDDGIKLDSHWFKLRELIYSQEDQCLKIVDPLNLCLDEIQYETENNTANVEYFLQRLPKLQEENIPDLLKSSFGFYKSKLESTEADYLEKISAVQDRIDSLKLDEFDTWIESLSTETGISSKLIDNIRNTLLQHDFEKNCFEWLDLISQWLIDNQEFGEQILPIDEVNDIFKEKMKYYECTYQYHDTISELNNLVKYWMQGKTVFAMAESIYDTKEKCKKMRKFIIRLLPNISFIYGLFPLVHKKMCEEMGSEESIPASFGALAGCIREGFNCPEKLAAYHIVIKRFLTSRVRIHEKFSEIEGSPDGMVESYNDLLRRISKTLNIKDYY